MPKCAVLAPRSSTPPPLQSIFVTLTRDDSIEHWNAYREPGDCYLLEKRAGTIVAIYEYERIA